MEKWVVKKDVGNLDKRKDVEIVEKNDRMCEKCYMLDKQISKYVDQTRLLEHD